MNFHCQENIKTLIAWITLATTWSIMAVRCRSLITARTFKSSRGEAKTLLCVDRNVSLKKTIRIVRKTLPLRSMVRNRNASSTRRKCGKSEAVIRPENGSIGARVATLTHARLVVFTSTYRTIHSNASMLVRSSIFEFSRTTGSTMEQLCAHRVRSFAVKNSPSRAKAARSQRRLRQAIIILKIT